jgi:nucleotide-binding universal stress UspA family protein
MAGAHRAGTIGAMPYADRLVSRGPEPRRAAPPPVLVVVRSSDPPAHDALALAARLAALQAAPLVVVPVADGVELSRIRAWARAVLPADVRHRVLPVAGPAPNLEIQAVALELGAQLIVVGSAPGGPAGRVHLDRWEASAVVHNAPCAVAVAPAGYRDVDRDELLAVGVAFDGLPESHGPLHSAQTLAAAAGARLRVIAVAGDDTEPAELARGLAALPPDAAVDVVEERGDVIALLTRASEDLDLLVCGSRDRRPLRRLALGRTPLALMRSAACPLVVVAPGTPIPATRRVSA